MTDVAARLLNWFGAHGRHDLPWQHQPTPYRVWVSEIMLQQTQVATVIPYYQRFMTAYPDVVTLAAAPVDDVLHHWSGLGYYARARNLHRAAVIVRDQHGGRFPADFEAVCALPGIGRSTAGAVLAIATGARHAILDGNVKRVLSRYHAIDGWPGQTAVAGQLWEVAERHTPAREVAAYTQAIMDLGATLCTRSKPRCPQCPLAAGCKAHALGRETAYPGSKPARAKPRKSTCMLLVHCDGELYLEQRPPSGIWGGLWSLPEHDDEQAAADWLRRDLRVEFGDVEHWPPLRHGFSHYDLHIQPLAVRIRRTSSTVADRGGRWYALATPPPVGLAAPVKKLIDRLANPRS